MILKRPELYHGQSQKRPFFEGWYHKMSTKNGESIVAIPGIYRSGLTDFKTAFLMIYNGESGKVEYIPFPAEEFKCHPNKYELHLGNNFFSEKEIKISLEKNFQ